MQEDLNIVKIGLETRQKMIFFFFLSNYLIIYIERKIAEKFDTDSIIDEVYDMKECRASIKV